MENKLRTIRYITEINSEISNKYYTILGQQNSQIMESFISRRNFLNNNSKFLISYNFFYANYIFNKMDKTLNIGNPN